MKGKFNGIRIQRKDCCHCRTVVTYLQSYRRCLLFCTYAIVVHPQQTSEALYPLLFSGIFSGYPSSSISNYPTRHLVNEVAANRTLRYMESKHLSQFH